MRPWWINAVKALGSPYFPYDEITIQSPPPIFEDKTMALQKFRND